MMKKHLFMLLFLFACLFQSSFASWWNNEMPCPTCRTMTASASVQTVWAASNILQSFSSFLGFLNQSELSSVQAVDFQKSRIALTNSVSFLSRARYYYKYFGECLRLQGKEMATLSFNFDHVEPVLVGHGLNPCEIDELRSIFSNGSLLGYIEWINAELDAMINQIQKMESLVSVNQMPDIKSIQPLYEKFLNLMKMGYHASLIFAEATK